MVAAAKNRRLCLVIPGLLDPFRGLASQGLAGKTLTSTPFEKSLIALPFLLGRARAKAQAGRCWEDVFAHLMGLDTQQPWGAAAYSYLGVTGRWSDSPVLRADLASVTVGMANLSQLDGVSLAIQAEEARALSVALQDVLAHDGINLMADQAGPWFLQLAQEWPLRTQSLSLSLAHGVNRALPTGSAAGRLMALLTEIQMVFHGHPVNQGRETLGQPLINSLWLWGEGCAKPNLSSAWQGLWGDDPLLAGMAKAAAVSYQPAIDDVQELTAIAGSHLVLLDVAMRPAAMGDSAAWEHALSYLEREWFVPLLAAINRGEWQTVDIVPVNGQSYRYHRRDRWQFWRRVRPLSTLK